MSKVQLSGAAVVLFLLMRLAAGYHFFTEGMKKLEPGFTSEHFLRGAKGPLADYFKSFAPGPHGAYDLLWQPRKWDSLSDDQRQEVEDWQAAYTGKLRDIAQTNKQIDKDNKAIEASGEGEPKEHEVVVAEFPPYSAYFNWASQIDSDWQQQHDGYLKAINTDKTTTEKADRVYRAAKLRLAEYLDSISQDVEEYQHSLWRLAELKRQVGGEGGTLPYQDGRIAKQEAEGIAAPRPWVAEVQRIEEEFHKELLQLAPDKKEASSVLRALRPVTPLDKVNFTVTCVVIGVGVLLFSGLFTRVAAIVGAGFLMSVIATQPPWVYGANTEYLGYQLFEISGLLLLAVVGPGRWLGFDGAIWALLNKEK